MRHTFINCIYPKLNLQTQVSEIVLWLRLQRRVMHYYWQTLHSVPQRDHSIMYDLNKSKNDHFVFHINHWGVWSCQYYTSTISVNDIKMLCHCIINIEQWCVFPIFSFLVIACPLPYSSPLADEYVTMYIFAI